MVAIEEWNDDDPRRAAIVRLVEACGQASWVFPHSRLEENARALVALEGDEPVGFLVFVVQEIGPPDSCPPLAGAAGEALTEAKVSAFAVRDPTIFYVKTVA